MEKNYIILLNLFFKKIGMNIEIKKIGFFKHIENSSKDFIDFINKLGFKVNITNTSQQNIMICKSKDKFYLSSDIDGQINYFDAHNKEVKANQSDIKYIDILDIENLKEDAFNITKIIKERRKYLNISYFIKHIILKILIFYLIFFFSTVIRVALDTSTYYQNRYLLSIYILLIIILSIMIYLLHNIDKKIISNVNMNLGKKMKESINVEILFQLISFPVILILSLYIISNIQKDIFNYSIFIVMNIVSVIIVSRSIKNYFLLKIVNLILNIMIIVYEVFLFYVDILIYLNDGLSLGIILLIQVLVFNLFHDFFDVILRFDNINNTLIRYDVLTYDKQIYIEQKNENIESFDIICNEFVFENKMIKNNIYIKQNTNVIIYGSKGSGKTLFAKTLLGIDKMNASRVILGNKAIFELDSNSINKYIFYLSNTTLNNMKFNLENNSRMDINFVYSELGIKYYNDKYIENQTSNSDYVLDIIAKGVLMNPKIIILDNVFINLSIDSRKKLLETIKKLELTLIVLEQEYIHELWDQIIEFKNI